MTRPQFTPKRLPRTQTSNSEFNKDERKQAWTAIQKLQSMLPQLRHFARSVTGNPKLDIKITAGVPQTRGNVITIRPPMGLGKDYRHNRSKCGTRKSDGQQSCKACQVREVIEFFLFHEIAHVAFKTQEAPTDADHIVVEKYITEWHPVGACNHSFEMRALTKDLTQAPDPQNLGRLMNEYLAIINNCLEDARVNARTFDARPGLQKVFDLNIEKLMTEGTEIGVNKYIQWTEAPLDSQFMVGLNMLAAGYPYEGRFAPSVVEALDDEVLQSICMQAVGSNDVHDIFALSVEVFRRAQVLGFCIVPKCQVPEPVSPTPPQPSDESDSDDNPSASGEDGTDPNSGSGEASEGDRDDSDESDGTDEPDAGDTGGRPEDSPGGDEGDQPEVPDNSGEAESDPDGGTEPGGEFGENEQGSASGGLRGDDDGTDESDEDGTSGSDDSDSDEPAGDSSTDDSSDDGDATSDQLGDGTSADGAESEVSGGRPSGIDPSTHDDAADKANNPGRGGLDQEADDTREEEDSDADRDGESRSDEDDSDQGTPGPGSTPGRDEDGPGADVEGGEDTDSDSGGDTEVEPKASDSHEDEDGDADPNPWGDLDDEFDGDEDGHKPVVENPWDVAAPEDPSPVRGPEPPDEPPSAPGAGLTEPELGHGTPNDIARAISRFLMHGTDEDDGLLDSIAGGDIEDMVGLPMDEDQDLPERLKELILVALAQLAYFDDASRNVAGVEEVSYPNRALRWNDVYDWKDFATPESLVGRALLMARRVFDDNKRGKHLKNLKSGRVNTRALGRRAPFGDPRVFERKIIPGKKSYFVVVGGDCSGSTDDYERNPKIKRAIMAQGDMLTRLGIKWAGYMHTAYTRPLDKIHGRRGSNDSYYVYILPFKKPEEAWNEKTKNKLANVVAFSDNLDGHTLQYYRKAAEKSDATTKIIIYYTDGAMPAANYEEERELLEIELALCKKKGIIVIAVGINTDSPKHYGMDTARVDSDEDLHKVVELLERHLL